MSSKHIYHSADGLVLKALRGAVALNPALELHAASKSVFISDKTHGRTDATRNPLPIVAVISGGGAGHEPAHAGYTGRGMLSASVSGDIFASPSAKQILQTIYLASSSGATLSEVDQDKQVHEWKDVLVIINNYTGDRLNFGLAIEKALASSHMKIESVVVTDDVSLLQPGPDSRLRARKSLVGPRGLAGNILVCKILGAFAHRGADLTRVKLLGDAVVHNLASVGVGLGHCHVPGRELNMNSLVVMTEEECEIGLGLHNEPGVVRKKMDGPDKLVAEMLDLIMRSRQGTGEEFMRVASDDVGIDLTDDIVLFINNLGGMSQLELAAVLDEVLGQLDSIGVNPMRVYSSTYMTSLNAPGFSISILNLSKIHQGLNSSRNWNTFVTVLELLDDPTDAVSWLGVRSWPVKKHGQGAKKPSPLPNIAMPLPPEPSRDTKQLQGLSGRIERGLRSACETVLLRQGALTEFDTVVGDGDCGETFAAGAKAILAMLDEGGINLSSITVSELVTFVANVLEERMGGTIGALFAIFLTAVSTSLKDLNCAPTIQYWGNALVVGLHALRKYTPAQPGDRTLIDALCPFCETMSQEGNTFEQAVDAAKKGAESTRYMSAVLGRAAYVTMPSTLEDLPPDPGAWGVVAILEGLCNGLTGDP
ncbi:Dihydroxyacetone kinase [Termitomyces sp. T112]|nr:Dihydroxyacetone kinase [Termitomyces sp. T112]